MKAEEKRLPTDTKKQLQEAEITRLRGQNWAIVFYEEDLPPNWKEIIETKKVRCILSPRHDKDLTEHFEVKKPHYHLIVCYTSPQDIEVVRRQWAFLMPNRDIYVEKVIDKIAQMRYLCHLDNKSKYPYNPRDVTEFGGIKYEPFVQLNDDKKVFEFKLIQEIKDFASIRHAVGYYLETGEIEKVQYIANHAYFIKEYLKGEGK